MATTGDPTGALPARQLTDDQRQAASMKVGISTYVATAALGVLAGALGLFTYISQTSAPPWTFYGLMLLTAAMLVISIVLGGDGQDKTVALVARGTWTNNANWQFNVQAVLTVLALLFLTAATAVGATAGKLGAPRPLPIAWHISCSSTTLLMTRSPMVSSSPRSRAIPEPGSAACRGTSARSFTCSHIVDLPPTSPAIEAGT